MGSSKMNSMPSLTTAIPMLSRSDTSSRSPSSAEQAGIRTLAGEIGSRTFGRLARRRFRLLTGHGMIPNVDSEESYLKAAQEVFQSDPTVAVFIFGHTHAAFLRSLGPSGQAVLNMGTWLKLLHRVPVRFGLLPAVYYPSYRLN
jgi:predicted phosphodiesterase